ncbi:MAG: methyltransferase domain-containing protein [Anaerolineales bacterium]|nr:methyltransferase domain-containing protein [Anaerolineales bacterium]MCB9145955.1 methyltransferase domain-containing protein [Anaerolineales bacterium]
MPRFTDRDYLTQQQYKNSSNLDVRVALHKRFSTNPYGWFNFVFDELSTLPANANILEVGCGTGELWRECANRIPTGWALTLTDLSEGMLDAAWRNLVVTGRNCKFENADVQSLPYADKTFDAVIANHMLYHVPDRKKALQEIKRVLKDDGVLFAATLGENHMHEMWDLLERVGNVKRNIVTSEFSSKNGEEQLREFFSRVELKEYRDTLCVTDLSAMIAYIRSMASIAELREEVFQSVEREFAEMFEKDGEISIEKSAVLFKASN